MDKIASVLRKNDSRSYNFYTSEVIVPLLDKYFSIYQVNGTFGLWNTEVQIDDKDNIHIFDSKFISTPGLWNLIMLNDPVDYSQNDLID